MTSTDPLPIVTLPDPILHEPALPVTRFDAALHQLLDRMAVTMYQADGIGLAGPQVGVRQRVLLVDIGDGLLELVNPVVIWSEGSAAAMEGCLSIPGILGEVTRPERVVVQGQDRHGNPREVTAEALQARALQHEIDHLDGILITDRATRIVEVPPEARLRLVFMGTPRFAETILLDLLQHQLEPVLVISQPDRRAGRGQRLRPSPVKELALLNDVPVFTPARLRGEAGREVLAQVAELAPDVLITAAYGRILPPEWLALPTLAAINVHASLLPKYRGAAPIQRALMAGEEETGVTIMHMAEALDAGDIILQERVPIDADDDAGSLHDKLAQAGANLLRRSLHLLAVGEAPRVPQVHALATLAPPLTAADERIDWRRPARELSWQIRALAPRPGAKARRGQEQVKLLRAQAIPGHGQPGRLEAVTPEALIFGCGEGLLRVTWVQPAGSRPMSVGSFSNGQHNRQPLVHGEQWT